MKGTTPPCEITTWPRSLFNLNEELELKISTKEVERTLRHCGWRAEGDGAQYAASCYHERHCQQVREFQQQGIQERQRGRLYDNVRLAISFKSEA